MDSDPELEMASDNDSEGSEGLIESVIDEEDYAGNVHDELEALWETDIRFEDNDVTLIQTPSITPDKSLLVSPRTPATPTLGGNLLEPPHLLVDSPRSSTPNHGSSPLQYTLSMPLSTTPRAGHSELICDDESSRHSGFLFPVHPSAGPSRSIPPEHTGVEELPRVGPSGRYWASGDQVIKLAQLTTWVDGATIDILGDYFCYRTRIPSENRNRIFDILPAQVCQKLVWAERDTPQGKAEQEDIRKHIISCIRPSECRAWFSPFLYKVHWFLVLIDWDHKRIYWYDSFSSRGQIEESVVHYTSKLLSFISATLNISQAGWTVTREVVCTVQPISHAFSFSISYSGHHGSRIPGTVVSICYGISRL